MAETVQKLFDKIRPVIYDGSTTITEKIESIVDHYISLLMENPDLPLFVVNEIMSGTGKTPLMKDNSEMFLNSYFIKQIQALRAEGTIQFHPVNIIMNMLGMILFPFLSRRVLVKVGAISPEDFIAIAVERKKLIPLWLNQVMNL